jgi:hypothetical protein
MRPTTRVVHSVLRRPRLSSASGSARSRRRRRRAPLDAGVRRRGAARVRQPLPHGRPRRPLRVHDERVGDDHGMDPGPPRRRETPGFRSRSWSGKIASVPMVKFLPSVAENAVPWDVDGVDLDVEPVVADACKNGFNESEQHEREPPGDVRVGCGRGRRAAHGAPETAPAKARECAAGSPRGCLLRGSQDPTAGPERSEEGGLDKRRPVAGEERPPASAGGDAVAGTVTLTRPWWPRGAALGDLQVEELGLHEHVGRVGACCWRSRSPPASASASCSAGSRRRRRSSAGRAPDTPTSGHLPLRYCGKPSEIHRSNSSTWPVVQR